MTGSMTNDFQNKANTAVTPVTSPPVVRRHGYGRPTPEGRRTIDTSQRQFFCNGDQFYLGQRVYVSRRRYPTLDRLLVDLSRMMAGAVNLPYGVRQIYSTEDGRRVESLEDIVRDGKGNFVCAGFEAFRPLQYGQQYAEKWCIGKPATNSLGPRDTLFQKNAKSCASLDAAFTEDAKSIAKNLDTSSGITRRSKPKPAKPYRPEKVTWVGPGEAVVTLERQSKGVETGSKAFSVVTSVDDPHISRRKINCSEASLPSTGTKWPQSLRRTRELFERSEKTLVSFVSLRKPGGTRKNSKVTSTWRKTAVVRDSCREIARSPAALEIRSGTAEIVGKLTDTKSYPPTASVPADTVKTAGISASSRSTSLGFGATPVSSRDIFASFQEIGFRTNPGNSRKISVSSQDISVSSRANPGSSLEISISSQEISIDCWTATVASCENCVSSNEIAAKIPETSESGKHIAAVALNANGKAATSAKNTIEFSPSHIPVSRSGAFSQTQKQAEHQAVHKIKSDAENDRNGTRSTKASRNSYTGTPERSHTNTDSLESADPEQLQSRKRGSKSRNRETSLKSKCSVDRLIVESRFLTERFQVGEVLGEGNFAVVKRCQARATKAEYAVKVISKLKMKGKVKVVDNELFILRRCRHPNVVRLIESYETKTEINIIMELVEGGDLFEAIRRCKKFPEVEASSMVKDMANALHYLHQKNIVHRDVKPENLLIQHRNDGSVKRLKLADFGLAAVTTGPLFKLCGTPTYVAPEILSDIGYRSEVDLWSVGVILYILLSGYPPFRSGRRSDSELFDLIQLGQFVFNSPHWDHISNGAQDLIRRLLEVTPRKRLRAEEVLRHPWIRGGARDSSPVSIE